MLDKVEIIHDLFLKVVNRFNQMEKIPHELPDGTVVYKAEIHTIVAIGNNLGVNVTELANVLSVTKGAISQITQKLLKKQFIVKKKDLHNDKEINLYLTEKGKQIYDKHHEMMGELNKEVLANFGIVKKEEADFLERFLIALHSHLSEHL